MNNWKHTVLEIKSLIELLTTEDRWQFASQIRFLLYISLGRCETVLENGSFILLHIHRLISIASEYSMKINTENDTTN
jgi:hypothetical protein